jgi:hypothetical protein
MKFFLLPLTLLLAVLISACGTDTSSSGTPSSVSVVNPIDEVSLSITNNPDSSNPQPGDVSNQQVARLSVNVTDAPLSGVVKVVVSFVAVDLRRASPAQSVKFDFNTPKQIDLLALQGSLSESILSDVEIPAGGYEEIRLIMDDANMSSYVELEDGSVYPLKIPSGTSSGLKIKGHLYFEANRTNMYTIDFDLLKSLVSAGASGKYLLKPVVRLVENKHSGIIQGEVDVSLLMASSCSDDNPDTYNAVYVYQGYDADPVDINTNSTANDQPITTSLIRYDSASGKYLYEAAYLPEGEYTIALTCNVDQEDPETDNDLSFFNIQNVSIQINDILFL